MSYLIAPEFKRFIQIDNLNQIINNDPTILNDAILDAQSTAKENLVQKYLIDAEMSDTDPYDPTVVYVPNDRVYLDAPVYDGSASYAAGALVSKDKVVYKNTTPITGPQAWTPSNWLSLGTQYSIWYVAPPEPEFDINAQYQVGNIVFRLGSVYTCKVATLAIDHTTLLQAYIYSNVPLPNIFPEDPVYGLQYWGAGTPITVSAGSFPTGFTEGDNRSRLLVKHMSAIVLYDVHSRIAPRNIPQLRDMRFKEAMVWLKDAKEGNITVDIDLIQPRAGGRVRWGSNIKNINSY